MANVTCPHCGKTDEPRDHNGRGPRCVWCGERVVIPDAPATPAEEPTPDVETLGDDAPAIVISKKGKRK